ncbi:aldehyde dehydrogenase [Nocardioides nitrophenolicus]|uniref:aldehyde dehydrogenase n=1 Tax=Nocardioides nitrophenolicus TaxID=60489 RepID=UPI00195BFE30|nr:aldehyde dehydrogenase [Nocardioides nitrophenolicus]MBM7520008.1 gamma-glutamyl-gamma-aminobutyraldehyde dehydrogenase [Nocardioides nitrophenolicus]
MRTHQDWLAEAAKVVLPTRPFVGGGFVDAGTATFENRNPATGALLAEVADAGAEGVDHAVRAARATFDSGVWSRAGVAFRRARMLRFADLLAEHAAELAVLDSLDMGKRVVDAHELDLPFSVDLFRYYAEAIDKVNDEVAPTPPGTTALVRRVPLGVVGAVVPWNYPVDMLAWKVAPAMAAGNSVVLKPAEQSPSSALRIAELAVEAGIPEGVLNVVPGLGETTGRALGLHPDVDVLAFTGSTEVGAYFLQYAGQSNLKQVWLECGGKSPHVVFADAEDLAATAKQTAFGIWFNQGAVCSAHSRVLVQREVHDEFVSLVAAEAAAYAPGDPLDPAAGMGAIVSPEQTDRIMRFVDEARGSGARLVTGGERVTRDGSDCYVQPTVFDGVDPASTLAREEVFGPVLAITPFDTEDEAVALANGTAYGLAASVATSSLGRAHRLADRIHAGTVTVNGVDAFSAWTPFGGFKGSGFGRDLSLHALDKYVGLKTVWINH